jgi:hypothetical protein
MVVNKNGGWILSKHRQSLLEMIDTCKEGEGTRDTTRAFCPHFFQQRPQKATLSFVPRVQTRALILQTVREQNTAQTHVMN